MGIRTHCFQSHFFFYLTNNKKNEKNHKNCEKSLKKHKNYLKFIRKFFIMTFVL